MDTKQDQFIQACESGDIKTVKALIIHPDVDPTGYDHHTIGVAACNGHKEVVEFLMQDSRVGPSNWDNYAIRFAAHSGHKDIVELLMQDLRVDPSDDDNYAIRLATYHGRKDIAELLLTDKRVMDKIEPALKWCKKWGGYELLKGCVDDYKRKKEKERRIQEAIKEMSADCELYF